MDLLNENFLAQKISRMHGEFSPKFLCVFCGNPFVYAGKISLLGEIKIRLAFFVGPSFSEGLFFVPKFFSSRILKTYAKTHKTFFAKVSRGKAKCREIVNLSVFVSYKMQCVTGTVPEAKQTTLERLKNVDEKSKY